LDAPLPKNVVYDKLFVYDDTYPKINRPTQVFTREMGSACAKRIMSKYPEDPSLGHSERWEFNPIQYEVLIVAHFSMSFEVAHTTRGLEDYTINYLMV
jgi:hypothetical protein